MGFGLNLTGLLTGLCAIYVSHSLYHFYKLFTPELCEAGSNNCLYPYFEPTPEGLYPLFQLRVYVSPVSRQLGSLIERQENFQIADSSVKKVNITLPASTLKNGTLFVHCYILPQDFDGDDPYSAKWMVQQSGHMTTYEVPAAETFNLMGGDENMNEKKEAKDKPKDKKSARNAKLRATQTPVSHLRTVIPLVASYEAPHLEANKVPGEIRYLMTKRNGKYLPIFYLDEMSIRNKDLVQIEPTEPTMEITIDYKPASIGKLRLLISTLMSFDKLKELGFKDKDIDEVKGIFVDTNLYLLLITVFVSSIHLLFDALSIKNDISFWHNRKSMVGLSTKALMWRCFSYTVIFFYLLDTDTSLLVLVPAGLSTLVEYWKMTKAFKVTFSFSGGLKWGEQTAEEAETDAFDAQAMKYLAWLMIPICIGGAVYSLAYVPHKSWRSWVLQSLANGVYAFGFLFMLPQLFVNYKLKSVAHLPWRAFMYKAFNTFIDDLFAFIITMPTAHRLACFRDDIVFLIYLYQRWLYPVDPTRVNEYGESGETDETEITATDKKMD